MYTLTEHLKKVFSPKTYSYLSSCHTGGYRCGSGCVPRHSKFVKRRQRRLASCSLFVFFNLMFMLLYNIYVCINGMNYIFYIKYIVVFLLFLFFVEFSCETLSLFLY